ncbi:MAG: cryptochrome/photolyase family protein [Balneolaceae bacterium]|nr:MAG: cryptochrome/photolyase family protein [Balneolaceae bacterium]
MTRPYLTEIDRKIPETKLSGFTAAVFILHDQLNLDAWPGWVKNEKPLLIFMESGEKGMEIPHHKTKAVYVLSSMRHFALECHRQGYPVFYHSTKGHFDDGLAELINQMPAEGVIWFMTPSEWDTRERIRATSEKNPSRFKEIPNGFFMADPEQWKAKIKPGYRMEFFYREMRRQTGYLMSGEEPAGGSWNYDEQNREKLPQEIVLPKIEKFAPDPITREVMEMVDEYFPEAFGRMDHFSCAVTRKQALKVLDQFIRERLDLFGPYEDALLAGNSELFHSQLSVYLNNGLLLPHEVCERAVKAWEEEKVRLNSAEGLIRQIIGWREFIRIYYEAMMPGIRDANHFGFTETLPDLYWTGDTEMNCLRESLQPVLNQGYAHHIQRLMILSNFSNLTETDPRELNRWFWIAFTDAYEWVELPNVLGMSTYADGGILASKPYVSGGNYIHKMGDYCKQCRYDVNKKTGPDACPFNYLYWNFVDKQRETFNQSGRVHFMVNMYDNRKSEEEKKAIRASSEIFLKELKRETQPKS